MVRHLAVVSALAWSLLVPAAVSAEDDSTPPNGTVTIDGGAAFSADREVDLDVAATDEVGVARVQVRVDAGGWIVHDPYVPAVALTLPDADGPHVVEVEWYDAAGNGAGAQATINLDRQAPQLEWVQETTPAPANRVNLQLGAGDQESGVPFARFSSDGATWGSPIPFEPVIAWNPFDPAAGGSGKLGPRTVHAQVRDGAGNWSATVKASVNVLYSGLEITVSPGPRTGSPITLHPTWPKGVAFPAGTVCWWEFVWGNDASIYQGRRDHTFGYLLTSGPPSSGHCGDWTFTLPWAPERQYVTTFRAAVDGEAPLGAASIGSSPSDPSITASVGSTDRRIRSSNLPMVFVLPSAFETEVGVPVTYTAYPLGGATLSSKDHWSAQVVDDQGIQKSGGSSFTFTPDRAGFWTVCWGTPTRQYQLSACYDPPVRRRSSTTATPAPPAPPAASAPPGTPSPAAPAVSAPASSSPSPLPSIPSHSGSGPAAAPTTPPPVAAASGAGTEPSAEPATGPASDERDPPPGALVALVLVAGGVAAGGGAYAIRRRRG